MLRVTDEKRTTPRGDVQTNEKDWKGYFAAVFRDYQDMIKVYPLSKICIIPSRCPTTIEIKTIAVDACTLSITDGCEQDFTDVYSRELLIKVPFDYQLNGCVVLGGKWIDRRCIKQQFWHFNGPDDEKGNHVFCVGVPASFINLDNVLLESVRTADNMLTAYRRYLTGRTSVLELNAYQHGERGEKEYEQKKRNRTG